MDKEKEIAEMRKVVEGVCNKKGIAKHCPERIAQAFYNADYRKADETGKKNGIHIPIEIREAVCSQLLSNGHCYLSCHLTCKDRDESNICQKYLRLRGSGTFYNNFDIKRLTDDARKELVEKAKYESAMSFENNIHVAVCEMLDRVLQQYDKEFK